MLFQPGVEHRVFNTQLSTPAVIGFLDSHGVQCVGAEVDQAVSGSSLTNRQIDLFEILRGQMQLPAEFAHV